MFREKGGNRALSFKVKHKTNYMNLQEIFDKVTEHLYKQGGPAKEQSSCQYLASGGKKCAVGCLIKSEFYDESLESHLIDDEIAISVISIPKHHHVSRLYQRAL